jgi:hypothetical protein
MAVGMEIAKTEHAHVILLGRDRPVINVPVQMVVMDMEHVCRAYQAIHHFVNVNLIFLVQHVKYLQVVVW